MALSQITFQFDDSQGTNNDLKNNAAASNQKSIAGDPVAIGSKRGRKSLKDMAADVSHVEVPDDETLFKKQYYSIGDVAAMFKENTSLIRYWENEFDILKPKKNKKGDRYFRPEDVKNLKMIYHLLRERKYTIEGAKEFLKHNKAAGERHEMIESLQKIKLFLLELKNNL